jgi:hypothetical protein
MTSEPKVFNRKCSTCGKGMNKGYVGDDGSYGCSDACWFTDGYTREMFAEDYEAGSAYWTEWEEYDGGGELYTEDGTELDVCFKCEAPQFTDSPFCGQCLTHL